MPILNFVQDFLTKREGLKEYQQKLKSFLQDAELSDEEKVELDALSKKYNLKKKDLVRLQKSAVSGVLQDVSSDHKITEEEKSALNALIAHFDLSLDDIKFDQVAFNKYYCLALIEQGILPEVQEGNHDINIVFKPKEVLHYGASAVLRKHKRVTQRINYGGFTGSVRIAKGLRYRVGSLGYGTESKEVLASVDEGAFYLTSQRIGYLGRRKQFSFPYKKVQSLELTPEGMYVFKEGRESPFILTLNDYEVPLAIVSFMLNEESDD